MNGLAAAGTSQQQQLLYKGAVHPDQEQHPAFRHRSTAARRSSAVGFHSPNEAAASSYSYGAAAYPEDPVAATSRGFHSPREQPQGQRGSFTSPRERLNERPPPPTRGYGVAGPSRPPDPSPQHSDRVTEPARQGLDRGHPSESHASDRLGGQAGAVKAEEGGQPTDLSKSRNGIIEINKEKHGVNKHNLI